MLAIKNILSRCDSTPTLIFDEIDTGVSGKASRAIANKLRSISEAHQVLCVTHTAQIAAERTAISCCQKLSRTAIRRRSATHLTIRDVYVKCRTPVR